MNLRSRFWLGAVTLAVVAASHPRAFAAERVTLRNGFELDCVRREAAGDRVRLYLMPSAGVVAGASVGGAAARGAGAVGANYIEVAASAVLRVESIPDPPMAVADGPVAAPASKPAQMPVAALTPAEMRQMLARAGARHNIDTDLLASVVEAESAGDVRAVSRAGARGLMQLMPGTATVLGVKDSFAPEENIGGGTAYLDEMLTRYSNNMKLALAAYNAGPEAVDRYHGIPPYAETQAYVARVIREFNRRKRAAGVGLMAAAK
ncbi:MAG: lytic transglycosylase domain-containing protein [Acidobacteriaceae bacterium]|jgi:soluble lytic murein transglycosylase-like protein